ncbi:MAG TPA: hypothetical protein VIZ17_17510 [Acetobacteraceae bacterium]
MTRRPRWLGRLASLSALASAALAASSGSGEAAIIYRGGEFVAPGSLSLPGGNVISLNVQRTGFFFTESVSTNRRRGAYAFRTDSNQASARGVQFRTAGRMLMVADRGQTFNKMAGSINSNPIIGRQRYVSANSAGYKRFLYPQGQGVTWPLNSSGWTKERTNGRFTWSYNGQKYTSIAFSASRRSSQNSYPNFDDKYALFRFNVGGQLDYGWLELSVQGGDDPFVDVLGYAYQTNGSPIEAGAVPEPQQLPAALCAFALGAIGLKEWRKERKAVA